MDQLTGLRQLPLYTSLSSFLSVLFKSPIPVIQNGLIRALAHSFKRWPSASLKAISKPIFSDEALALQSFLSPGIVDILFDCLPPSLADIVPNPCSPNRAQQVY
ncbi:MAG: hypothetical protein ACAH17_03625, partial [Candidatus Paceibacterota bacterium]